MSNKLPFFLAIVLAVSSLGACAQQEEPGMIMIDTSEDGMGGGGY